MWHIIVSILFGAFGAIFTLSVVLGLPGAWMTLGLAVLIEVIDDWWRATPGESTFGWWLLGACAIVAVVGEILEFAAGALGAKRGGSSRRGVWGALIGGLVGAVLGLGIPIPIVGSLIGALIGTFAGAIIGEMTDDEVTLKQTLKPAAGATIARIIGTLAKLPLAMVIWVALVVRVCFG